MAEAQKPVLADHRRKNKRLVPPLLEALGDKHSPYSWARELVPQFLWIAMLQRGMGFARGTEFALQMALSATKLCTQELPPAFSKITSYDFLSDQEKNVLSELLSGLPHYNDAMAALAPMFGLLPNSPLEFLARPDAVVDEHIIYDLLPKLYDRHDKAAVMAIAASIYIGFRQGKLRLAGTKAPELRQMLVDDFKAVEDYPTTEASRAAGASLRAMAPVYLLGDRDDAKSQEWLVQFWEQVGAFGDCVRPLVVEYDPEPDDNFWKMLTRYRNGVRRELYDRLERWSFDLNAIEAYEVIGALLARQVTLAADLAAAPPIWTPHSAPIFLRAMADVYIALAWIFDAPQERAKNFIEDGLGTVKLEIAHRKAELEKAGGTDQELIRVIDYWERWLRSQRMDDLVEVNLGNWAGRTTRRMAEEAGCLDFYNYVYQPFSAAIHSSWPHVSDKNLQYCMNPAHRFHRLAVSVDLEPSPHWLVLAGKYLEKAFALFDVKTGTQSDLPSAYDELLQFLGDDEGDETPPQD